MAHVTQDDCDAIAASLNSRPRKRLGFRTPEECHVKARSTRASALYFKLEVTLLRALQRFLGIDDQGNETDPPIAVSVIQK